MVVTTRLSLLEAQLALPRMPRPMCIIGSHLSIPGNNIKSCEGYGDAITDHDCRPEPVAAVAGHGRFLIIDQVINGNQAMRGDPSMNFGAVSPHGNGEPRASTFDRILKRDQFKPNCPIIGCGPSARSISELIWRNTASQRNCPQPPKVVVAIIQKANSSWV